MLIYYIIIKRILGMGAQFYISLLEWFIQTTPDADSCYKFFVPSIVSLGGMHYSSKKREVNVYTFLKLYVFSVQFLTWKYIIERFIIYNRRWSFRYYFLYLFGYIYKVSNSIVIHVFYLICVITVSYFYLFINISFTF